MGTYSDRFDFTVKDANGFYALCYAVKWRSKDIVAYTLEHQSFCCLSDNQDPKSLAQLMYLLEKDQHKKNFNSLHNKEKTSNHRVSL